MSWHKMPGEKQEHYDMFMVWLGLTYEDPPKERSTAGRPVLPATPLRTTLG
jgi:hypothetical protein